MGSECEERAEIGRLKPENWEEKIATRAFHERGARGYHSVI
jgi:hypothetical protein